MYHTFNQPQNTDWNISSDCFRKDMEYLRDNGYTTITIQDLIDFSKGNFTMPSRPIIITIDDGKICTYEYAFPILKEFNKRATIFPIASDVSLENPGFMTRDHVLRMHESGLFDWGNHTWAMHHYEGSRHGVLPKPEESSEDYRFALTEDLQRAQHFFWELGIPRPQSFAFPFGVYVQETKEILVELGFKALLRACITWNESNCITPGNPEELLFLNRINRDYNVTLEDTLKFI